MKKILGYGLIVALPFFMVCWLWYKLGWALSVVIMGMAFTVMFGWIAGLFLLDEKESEDDWT
jgi:hypothetical protein